MLPTSSSSEFQLSQLLCLYHCSALNRCFLVLAEWKNKLVSPFRFWCLLGFQFPRAGFMLLTSAWHIWSSRDPVWTERRQMNQSSTWHQWNRERRTEGRVRWSFNSISERFLRILVSDANYPLPLNNKLMKDLRKMQQQKWYKLLGQYSEQY